MGFNQYLISLNWLTNSSSLFICVSLFPNDSLCLSQVIKNYNIYVRHKIGVVPKKLT